MIKALSMIGKSGRLTVASGGNNGQIYLKSGNVIYAEDGKLRGEEALYSMALKSAGYFEYDPVTILVDQNIHLPTDSLFIGLSSQVDRYNYLLSRCPVKLKDRLTIIADEVYADQYDNSLRKILQLLHRPLNFDTLLEKSPFDRIKTIELVSKLCTDKTIGVSKKSTPVDQEGTETEKAEPEATLETNLKVVSIGEVVQILVIIHRDGHLSALWDDREGDVFIQRGNITFATVESLEGLGAVYRLLTWKDGDCKFFADVAPEKQNIRKNIESIFVEGIDILAKFNKFMDEFPSLNAYIDVISVTGDETINEKEGTILKVVNAHETLNDVIKHSPFSDVETLEIVVKLYNQRIVGLSKGVRGQNEFDFDKDVDDLYDD